MVLESRYQDFLRFLSFGKQRELYPFFRLIDSAPGPVVEVDGRRLLMLSSNDYLGLAHDPRIIEASVQALHRWGTATGGSRFLCGNLTLHQALEEKLAAFLGKRKALVFSTGFSANLGGISALLKSEDIAVCDRQIHASLFDGVTGSAGTLIPYAHNDNQDALRALRQGRKMKPRGAAFLITEGIFSMSGDLAALPELLTLKRKIPDLLLYLDDAHGFGVLGAAGRGTAEHFGVTREVDFIMGTFSKSFASVGGFIASDNEDVLEYLRHHSRTLIFSAALPAANVAAVLACLDVLEQEPERLLQLRQISACLRTGLHSIGLHTNAAPTPVVPIHMSSEEKAYKLARDLYDAGVFALPSVYPAVPKGRAIIRIACMVSHEERHIQQFLDVLAPLVHKYKITKKED